MTETRANRVAGWSGIAFSLLSLAIVPLCPSPPPAIGATAEAFTSWYAEHRAGFLVGNYLGIAAFIPGFVQLAALAARFRAREAASGWLGSLVLSSGTFAYAAIACLLIAIQTLPFLADPANPQAMLAIAKLGAVWFALVGLSSAPVILAIGWATLATGALPRWFAHLSFALAAVALVMSGGALVEEPAWLAAGGPATLAGFVAFFAWTSILGVLFLRLE